MAKKDKLDEEKQLRATISKYSRSELETLYVKQQVQINSFLRVMKKLKQSITELTLLGM